MLIICFPIQVISQTIEFEDQSDFIPFKKLNNDLDYLSTDSLIEEMVFVAKIIGRGNELTSLYWNMHHESTSKGANVYQLISFNEDTLNQIFVCEWNLYYSEDLIRELNIQKINTNTVFVFGNANELSRFKVNGQKQQLRPKEYYSTIIEKGEYVKINKGGLTGMTFKLAWRAEGSNRYLGIGGGSLRPGTMNSSIGLSMTTGSLEMIDREVGAFLSQIYLQLSE
jgi:hypothetical protein